MEQSPYTNIGPLMKMEGFSDFFLIDLRKGILWELVRGHEHPLLEHIRFLTAHLASIRLEEREEIEDLHIPFHDQDHLIRPISWDASLFLYLILTHCNNQWLEEGKTRLRLVDALLKEQATPIMQN